MVFSVILILPFSTKSPGVACIAARLVTRDLDQKQLKTDRLSLTQATQERKLKVALFDNLMYPTDTLARDLQLGNT